MSPYAPKVLNNGTIVTAVPSAQLGYLPLEQSPGVIALLQDRMDDQEKAMEILRTTVNQLLKEREQDQRTIQELRGELQTLTNRLAEKGISIHTERKLEQWHHQVTSEMHALHHQLQLYKERQDGGSAMSLTNELYDSRRLMRDECESFRRDIDAIKSRLVKIELHLMSLDGEKKELYRSQERFDRTMQDVLEVHHTTSQDLNRTKDSINMDKQNLSALQTNYQALKYKLGALETQVSDTSSQRSYPRRKKASGRNRYTRSLPIGITSPTTSDLDFEPTYAAKTRSMRTLPNGVQTPTTSDLELGLTDSDDDGDLKSSDIVPPPKEYSEHHDIDSEEDYLLTDLNISTDNLSSTDDTLNLDHLK
jgi:hypothetical protein